MSSNPKLPPRFKSWFEYADTYNVDLIPDWVLRCRKCAAEWPMDHYRGKLVQRAHRCPNGCNGKPREPRSSAGYAPAIVVSRQRAAWEHSHGWKGWEYHGPDRSAPGIDEGSRRERQERKRQSRRETKRWFQRLQGGWRPPTSAERAERARSGLDLLDALHEFPDPIRVLFAWENQHGRSLNLFLDRWRDREDWGPSPASAARAENVESVLDLPGALSEHDTTPDHYGMLESELAQVADGLDL